MIRRVASLTRDFPKTEAAGGVVMIAAAAAALVFANLPATADAYAALLHLRAGPMTLHGWVNDGLMALFFLLVGLEIKREVVEGRLASAEQRRLPVIAAIAGMAVPAVVYLIVTAGVPGLARGWAIPAATDIAFAMGVLALLGRCVPPSLKLFLTTVAIVDDMGAVAIIAVAYTDYIDVAALAGAGGVATLLFALGRRREQRLVAYLAGFALLWLLVLLSGVHPTIAGVVTALMVPVKPSAAAPADACPERLPQAGSRRAESPLHRLERGLHRYVAFGIVPLFAFANAGVRLDGFGLTTLIDPLVLGIALGLFAGKQAGILGAVWIAERIGIARRPEQASWAQIYGIALLAGIGFTMSLFIGGLAFPGAAHLADTVKIGVLAGSALSAITGFAVLRLAGRT